jgi:diaminopimelate epimerase
MILSFVKYHGAGNDFILFDNRVEKYSLDREQISALCNRHFGIGADGLILLEEHVAADFLMRYFNADGREATFCGNGARCAVAFARYQGIVNKKARFMAADGLHFATFVATGGEEDAIRLSMGDVDEVREMYDGYFIDTGSPHFILFKPNIEDIEVAAEGKVIRNQECWGASGVNVNFAAIESGEVKLRTYERGVEAETLSCGTGAVAAALAAAVKQGLQPPVRVAAKGGKLIVHFKSIENKFIEVQLEGRAKRIFNGNIEVQQ